MSDLNPEEIESIEIIKGPAAATLYGTEASAGVIQIITKRGNVGAPEFTFEVQQGTNFMIDPAGTLGDQWSCSIIVPQCPEANLIRVNMYRETTDYLNGTGRFAGLDLTAQGPRRSGDLYGYGFAQRYNLSVRGGTDQIRYFLSGGLGDETGIIDYNTDRDTNLRANVTVVLSENLSIDASTGYGQGSSRFATYIREGAFWQQLTWSRPQNLPGVQVPDGRGFLGFQERFPEQYEDVNVTREFSRFTGSLTATHTYGDWLTQRLTLGVDKGWDVNTQYFPQSADFPAAPAGSLEYDRPINQNITLDYALSGRYQLTEAIGTTTSVGVQYYARKDENLFNTGLGFATPVQTTINQADATSAGFTSIENKTLGFYVQEEFGYRDRIFLTAALRGDDNSAFGSDFDLQYYPKLSGSWVVSEEDFWNVGFVNSLRLRAAWGRSGRQPSTFASQTLFGTYEGPDGKGLVAQTAGNPGIGPEVSTELEVGFEVAVLDDRLSADFSWYKTTTEDLLIGQALAPSVGLPSARDANVGSMESWGWEVSVDARLVQVGNVAFDLNLAADYTTNEITSLGDTPGNGGIRVGYPFPSLQSPYILREAALDGTGQTIRAETYCDGGRPAEPGGDPVLQGGDTVLCSDYSGGGLLLGPVYPNYTLRVAPTLTLWQDLQVFGLAEGQYGRWTRNLDAEFGCRVYLNCRASQVRTDPFFVAAVTTYTDQRYRSQYLADFWKLREIGARYTLPQSLVSRIGADRASVSVSGRNLWTIWNRNPTDLAGQPLHDPEYANGGNSPNGNGVWELPPFARLNATLRVAF